MHLKICTYIFSWYNLTQNVQTLHKTQENRFTLNITQHKCTDTSLFCTSIFVKRAAFLLSVVVHNSMLYWKLQSVWFGWWYVLCYHKYFLNLSNRNCLNKLSVILRISGCSYYCLVWVAKGKNFKYFFKLFLSIFIVPFLLFKMEKIE